MNVAMHSEICAVPIERLQAERELLRPLPSLRPEFGVQPVSRKVDKLSCIRSDRPRYSVPCRLIGQQVTVPLLEYLDKRGWTVRLDGGHRQVRRS